MRTSENLISKKNKIKNLIGLNRKRERLRLLSPSNFNNNNANVGNVNSSGNLNNNNVNNTNGVRPVVTLSMTADISEGDGSYDTPYVIGDKIVRNLSNYEY